MGFWLFFLSIYNTRALYALILELLVAPVRIDTERAVAVTSPDDSLSSRTIATGKCDLKSSLFVSPREGAATRIVLETCIAQPTASSLLNSLRGQALSFLAGHPHDTTPTPHQPMLVDTHSTPSPSKNNHHTESERNTPRSTSPNPQSPSLSFLPPAGLASTETP